MWTFLYHKEKGIFITLNRVCNLSMVYPYPVTDEELAVGSITDNVCDSSFKT